MNSVLRYVFGDITEGDSSQDDNFINFPISLQFYELGYSNKNFFLNIGDIPIFIVIGICSVPLALMFQMPVVSDNSL